MSIEWRLLYVAGGVLLLMALWLTATIVADRSSDPESACVRARMASTASGASAAE